MLPLLLAILLQHLSLVRCVEVTPNSQCAAICINQPNANLDDKNASSTQPYQLVCNDWELSGPNSTSDGRKFHDCVACQSNSTASDETTKENDLYWFLFNIKYTIDHCVFSFENDNVTVQNLQCADSCAGPSNAMESAMTDRVLQTNSTIQYQYCKDGNGAFQKNVNACTDCLRKVPSSNALVNYLRALDQACDQQPPIGGTTPLKLDFDLYNTTAPPSTTTSSPAVVTVTSPPHTSNPASSSNNSHSVALGAGLGLGLGIPLLCLLGLLIYLYRRQRTQHHNSSSELQGLSPKKPRSKTNPSFRAEMHGSSSLANYHEADSNNNNSTIQPPAVPEKDYWNNNTTKSEMGSSRMSKSELSSRPSRGGSVQELTGSPTAAVQEMPSKGSLREVHPTSRIPEDEEERVQEGVIMASSGSGRSRAGSRGWGSL